MIETTKGARHEVTLPAAVLVDLLGAARASDASVLRENGRTAGRLLAEKLLSPQVRGGDARSLPTAVFWKRIGDIFSSRGWGTLAHTPGAPGVGELRSSDWIEADRIGHDGHCDFTAGVLQGLLEKVSAASIMVEETECRAAGGVSCRFLFGSPAAVRAARAAEPVTRP